MGILIAVVVGLALLSGLSCLVVSSRISREEEMMPPCPDARDVTPASLPSKTNETCTTAHSADYNRTTMTTHPKIADQTTTPTATADRVVIISDRRRPPKTDPDPDALRDAIRERDELIAHLLADEAGMRKREKNLTRKFTKIERARLTLRPVIGRNPWPR